MSTNAVHAHAVTVGRKPEPNVILRSGGGCSALFEGASELRCVPFVVEYIRMPKFHRLSIDVHYLMAEFNKGAEWWVIGYIERPEEVDLPRWQKGATS